MKSWDEIERTNKVARALRGMTNRANEVSDGTKRVAWLYGPTGVGKSHTMRNALVLLKIKGLQAIECAPVNYRDMLKHFEETEGRRPIIFEEADVIWRSSRMLNILKIATDPIREPHERVVQGVSLTAPIFVTTNVDLTDRSDWSRELHIHGPALFRRNAPRGVPNDREALYEYSVALALYFRLIDNQIIEDGDRPRTIEVRSLNRRVAALNWFSANYMNLVSVSPGTLQSVAEAFDYPNAFDQELELEALMVAERKRKAFKPASIDWQTVIKSTKPVS